MPHTSDLDLSLARIEEAASTIDPVFLNTPQFVDEQLCEALGRRVMVKVETANPLRSFKGRGADFVMGRLDTSQRVVCSSTGNFGQAMAHVGRRRGIGVEVFVPADVNPVKLARMKGFGARVTVGRKDSAAGQEAARNPVSTDRSDTIADGIEVRVPIPESGVRLQALVDDMVLVDDTDLLEAMRLAARTLGLLLEPAGAAGLAAIRVCDLPGERLATVLTGSNLRPEQLRGVAT